MKKIISHIFVVSLLLSSAAVAQERIAGGSMETQMTWTALSTMAKAAKDSADLVNSRVDKSVECGRQGMVYAPGATGDGCAPATMDPTLVSNVNNIIRCGQQGRVYVAATNTCVTASAPAPTCTLAGRYAQTRTSRMSSTGNACNSNELWVEVSQQYNASSKGQDSTTYSGYCLRVACN